MLEIDSLAVSQPPKSTSINEIVKRDGSRVRFEADKIQSAINAPVRQRANLMQQWRANWPARCWRALRRCSRPR